MSETATLRILREGRVVLTLPGRTITNATMDAIFGGVHRWLATDDMIVAVFPFHVDVEATAGFGRRLHPLLSTPSITNDD